MASELFVDNIYPGPNSTSIELSATSSILFKTNGSTRLTIDSSGRLLTPNQVYFYARANSGTTTSGSNLPFSIVDYNIGNGYNSSNYTFTAPVAGVYNISYQFFSNPNGGGGIDLHLNGVLTQRSGREGTENYYEGFSNCINKYLNVGDTLALYVYSGTVHYNTPFSHFSAYLLG